MRYRDAGVDIARAEAVKGALAEAVRRTHGPAVRSLPGGFAGVMGWPGGGRLLLAATMDGVGTKLHLARAAGRLADAAADLVYHGANDLLAHGGRPLGFLDYVAQARLEPEAVQAVVDGLSRACVEVGAALLGGETAEMPDTYLPEVVDVAGCMIGVMEERGVLDGRGAAPGDVVLGLASSGLHTNGYSLARRVLADSGLRLSDPLPGGSGESLGAALLAPHRWYGRAVLPLLPQSGLRAMAHVTGGGIAGNLVRVLPEGTRAVVRASSWPRPPVFEWLIRSGEIPEEEARQAFNLGVGWLMVCDPREAGPLAVSLRSGGETVFEIGELERGERGVKWES